MWWTEWHWDKFFSEYCGFFQSLSPHLYPILVHLHVAVTRRTKGEDWELSKKQCSSEIGEHSIETFLRFFFSVWRLAEIPVTRQTASTRVYLHFYPCLETRVEKLSRSTLQYKTIKNVGCKMADIKIGKLFTSKSLQMTGPLAWYCGRKMEVPESWPTGNLMAKAASQSPAFQLGNQGSVPKYSAYSLWLTK